MSYPIWSVRGVIEWAKKEQPMMPYEYYDASYCVCAMYARAMGVPYDVFFSNNPIEMEAAAKPHTYGAFVERLEALEANKQAVVGD